MTEFSGSHFHRLLDELQEAFPQFRIQPKQIGAVTRWLGRIIFVLTLGRVRAFNPDCLTVKGCVAHVPMEWLDLGYFDKLVQLHRIREYLRQWKELGWWRFFLKTISPWKVRLEQSAYAELLRAVIEYHNVADVRESLPALLEDYRAQIIKDLTSARHLLLFTRERVEHWVDKTLNDLLLEAKQPLGVVQGQLRKFPSRPPDR